MLFEDNKKSNLSPVAKKVYSTLTPFYIEILSKKNAEGASIIEIMNKMINYGSKMAKSLDDAEREFFESQIKPLFIDSIPQIMELKQEIEEKKSKQEIDSTEANIKINFLNGVKKEADKVNSMME